MAAKKTETENTEQPVEAKAEVKLNKDGLVPGQPVTLEQVRQAQKSNSKAK